MTATDDQEPEAEGPIPPIDVVQTDIGFGNQYRLELIKTCMTMAVGLLAFTFAFRPTLVNPCGLWLMQLGWGALGISTLGGLLSLHGWERFYLSYWKYKAKPADGVAPRKEIQNWRQVASFFLFAGFAVGVASIALFAIWNIDKVKVGG